MKFFFSRWLDRFQPSESLILGGAALLVGLLAGAGVWLFKRLIDLAHWAAFDAAGAALHPLGAWTVMLLPIAGGLIVGVLMYRLVGEERHHGVAGIMEATALSGGRLRYQRVPFKVVAAALSIGSGASVGPEDPSVQIGANLGSLFGQVLHLSDERVRALVAAGAAAGIAAAFNAPIAGVFFALEIVLGELSGNALGVVVLAAVVSSVFTQAVSGSQPAFAVPAYAFNSIWELPLYLGLGLIAGPIAALYIRALYAAQDGFKKLALPRWLRPAIAGGMVGLVGIFLPQIFGVGYETIGQILGGEKLSIALLLVILAAKLILTSVSIGGGFPGGVFAPSLFIGAMLGSAYGASASALFPALRIAAPAFAMVGMAAVLAGSVHSPLTAILLLFEMTNDYRIILPLMFAVMVSLLISRRLQPDSVYTLGLARKGIRIQRGRDVDVLETVTVGEVMQTNPPILRAETSAAEAVEIFLRQRHHGLPVLNAADELVGVLTLQDLEKSADGAARAISEICSRDLLTAHPDETIGAALRRMSLRDIGRLPVVARDHPRHLLGLLRRTDLVRAYDAALTQRETARHQVQQIRLDAMTGNMAVDEFIVEAGAPCDGQPIVKADFPRGCLIASLRRGRKTLVPRGDTILLAGDALAIVCEPEMKNAVTTRVKKSL